MQFTTLFVSMAAAAGLASAAPVEPNIFKAVASAEGLSFDQLPLQASTRSLLVGLSAQGASCGTPAEDATFQLTAEGELFLYSNAFPKQQLYVDRSGMGRGKIGYTTGAEPKPKNSERVGFAIQDNVLTFDGEAFSACPAPEGFAIWAGAGYDATCAALQVKVTESAIAEPNTCLYTS